MSEMLRGLADLHVHTSHSDGGCSPGEVIRAAAAVGLSSVAITDHDTLSALPIAGPEADRLGIELVAGIELTAEYAGRIHILGHFVRQDDPSLLETCGRLRVGRRQRAVAMVDRLHALGMSIDIERLERAFPRASLGRKHLADWLVRSGQVATKGQAFADFLGAGGPADVPKPRVPAHEAIALIRAAGGVAGLAHPPYDLRRDALGDLAEAGLGAIEVNGPGISSRLGQRWSEWADVFALVPIAGSDFHVSDRPGRWVGSITTSAFNLERLRRARSSG